MAYIRRFDHVGITVADLDAAIAFFEALGLEAETRMFVEGEFLDTVIGITNSRTEIVMLRPPDGGTTLELSSFIRPAHLPGSPTAPANELGLRNVAFEVHDLQAAVDRAATDGYGLIGGIVEYEVVWRMAYVRGPRGLSSRWPNARAESASQIGRPEHGGIAAIQSSGTCLSRLCPRPGMGRASTCRGLTPRSTAPAWGSTGRPASHRRE
jgi:catechol 2,3-dioxygenase-like lactoylglutathione lyase family enzyme